MAGEDRDSVELIDEFINTLPHWERHGSYYMNSLIPRIIAGDPLQGSAVADVANCLRVRLTPEELSQLASMVELRRAGEPLHIRSDVERELEREAELEAIRRAVERDARKKAVAARIEAMLAGDFLHADEFIGSDDDFGLLSDEEHLSIRAEFVRAWAQEKLRQSLDLEQAAAVAACGCDVEVVARAGAGKTRTLVTRALFLQLHCRVPPDQLLLLAFNRAAALEMRERMGKVLGANLPHIMTFHALAYALVHPDEELLYDEPAGGGLGLSREIQRVIDEHLQSEEYRPLIRDLMLMHFREDWERIVEGGFHLRLPELIEYRRTLPRETLRGEYVKSFGERLIANTLFENGIDYRYERSFRWNGINYRPDFTILLPDRRIVVIEYFGLQGDLDYDRKSQEKRVFWSQRPEAVFLEYSPTDIAARGATEFAALLLEHLVGVGVRGERLSEEEIWERIRRRAVDRFTGAVRAFVSRCRKRNLEPHGLRELLDMHSPASDAERLFLQVGASVHENYVKRLVENNAEDFDGLMWRAVALLGEGQSKFVRDAGREKGDLRNMRYVLVDEFQDFSAMFYELAQGIRGLAPPAEFFCVGDDWQAINGFAGSELAFFEDFDQYFREPTRLNVTTNYRSPPGIVRVGNALMHGRGAPAVPHRPDAGSVRLADLSEFEPTASEQAAHENDEATPALLRVLKPLLDAGLDVVMLSRRNGAPWYVNYRSPAEVDGLERFAEHVRSFLPEEDRERVTASTAHKYKGLEKKAVIVLDANQGSYPLLHPNWVFLRVFGDSVERIESEERRLFYVALTRSQDSLIVLYEGSERRSPYLDDIEQRMKVDYVEWQELRPLPSLDGSQLEIRVRFAYDEELNEQLRRMRYRWHQPNKCWRRSLPSDGFDFSALCAQPWVTVRMQIEVWSEDGEMLWKR